MNEEKKNILRMLEQGLISAEEAEELLESVEQAEKIQEEGHALSPDVDWNYQQNSQQNQSKEKKSKKFFDFIDSAIQKIKNVDLDLNFGQHFEVSHIFHEQKVSLSEIDFNITNGSLVVKTWPEKDVRLECHAKVYQVDSQAEARKKFLSDTSMKLTDGRLFLSIPSKKQKTDLVLYVPDQAYDSMQLRMFNGSIEGNALNVNKLKARTANGAIKVADSHGQDWDVETSNGTISLTSVACGSCELETLNGSISMDGTFNKVDARVVTGSIRCNWFGETGNIGFFESKTGNIRLHLPEHVHIDGELETNIGNINCELPVYDTLKEEKEVLKKLLHFEANKTKRQTLHIEAKTKTGSVWIKKDPIGVKE